MPSAYDAFLSRFGGQPPAPYNPFQAAPNYQSSYTPGAFNPPAAPGLLTPPAAPGGGLLSPPAPGNVMQGGEINDPGGNNDNPGGLGQGNPGYAPGYSDTAALIGAGLGLAIPGAGSLVNCVTAMPSTDFR